MSGNSEPHQSHSSPWKVETHRLVAPKHFDVTLQPPDTRKEVVVVTGSSGFLGQHIVKHLLEQNQFPIREVRVFDVRPFKWFDELNVTAGEVSMRTFEGDVCNPTDLQKAFIGASVVIHNASIIDSSTYPGEKLHRINVQGTESAIQTCINTNVKYLIYTSSVSAETRIGAYGLTKRLAEDLVLQANGKLLQNGETLRTCALRPIVMYGEGDMIFVKALQRLIVRNVFYRVGDDVPRFQTAYVGNIALGFVSAVNRIRCAGGTSDCAGRHFYLTDDTPVTSCSGFHEQFARHIGAQTSKFYVPFWMLRIAAHISEWISFILSPFYTLRLPISKSTVQSMYKLPMVAYVEATKYLGYKPVYRHKDILPKCLDYYDNKYKLMIQQ